MPSPPQSPRAAAAVDPDTRSCGTPPPARSARFRAAATINQCARCISSAHKAMHSSGCKLLLGQRMVEAIEKVPTSIGTMAEAVAAASVRATARGRGNSG